MTFRLTEDSFSTANKVSYEFSKPVFDDEKKTVDVNDTTMFLCDINYEICGPGMDNQDECNEYGKKLYQLYDEILLQKA